MNNATDITDERIAEIAEACPFGRSSLFPRAKEIIAIIGLLRRAETERDAVKAVVAKLPVTADGVPIVPGMQAWNSDGYSAGLFTPVMWTTQGVNQQCTPLYFSREAAIAAKGK